jgi:carbonic anhydrase/acetyltransferase-like protein (isoleucine patch superfamily)
MIEHPAIRSFRGITPTIATTAYIDRMAVVVGDVTIGDAANLWPFCSVRGDINRIMIGDRTNIQDNCTLHVGYRSEHHEGAPLIIGSDVTVGHQVILHGCSIGDEVLIGMGSIILDHTVIQSQVLIGAGSLVPSGKVLERGYLYLGNPAKAIRLLKPEELAFFKVSAQRYVETAMDYR